MDWQDQLENLGIVVLAGLVGGVVGLEREFARKPAGLRTHIFVAAAAALLFVLAQSLVDHFQEKGEGALIQTDPLRVIEAVVVGVSFLGAGTIWRTDASVRGLTTAASLLATAAIGLAMAAREFVLAVGTAVFAVLVLQALARLEHRVLDKSDPGGGSRNA